MTVVHPVITAARAAPPNGLRGAVTVDDYFNRGVRKRPFLGSQVTWHHRTVEDHVDALVAAGLKLTALRECPPVADRIAPPDGEELERRRRAPLFLLLAGARP